MPSVVQRMDSVTEGMQSYGGKINAVETDLKKLGNLLLQNMISNSEFAHAGFEI